MKLLKKVTPIATAASLAIAASTIPMAANAAGELTANLGVGNMYLWRGQNVAPSGGHVHGTLQYDISGFYGGVWASSEFEGTETDLYVGYGNEFSGFRFDVSYWAYLYPENKTEDDTLPPNRKVVSRDLSDHDAADVVVALGFGPIDAAAYINVDSDIDDNVYYTISGTWNQFTLLYGFWDLENGTIKSTVDDDGDLVSGQDQYSHIQFSYAFTDALVFDVSFAQSDLDKSDPAAVTENPLFHVGYSWDFKL